MDTVYYGWIEIVFSFGLVLAFCGWQLWDLRRLKAEREASQQITGAPTDPPESSASDGANRGGG